MQHFVLASLAKPLFVDSLKTVSVDANPVRAAACKILLDLLALAPEFQLSPQISMEWQRTAVPQHTRQHLLVVWIVLATFWVHVRD